MRMIMLLVFVCGSFASTSVTTNDIAAAENLFGLDFSDGEKRAMLIPGLADQLSDFQGMRKHPLPNSVPPAFQFNPLPVGFKVAEGPSRFDWKRPQNVRVPVDRDELAFYSVAELSALLHSRQITSVELTKFFLGRLKELGPRLECVATLTEELALEQAARADEELAAGIDRGPLHGIPYGAKDLLGTSGIATKWGSAVYEDQVPEEDAEVITQLRNAGAVLVAKLTLGELAMGDVWHGGRTRNPWNPEDGSSGSSAGSAAATAAGLVPFSIGSETLGSIVSPCTRCGATGLRPTFGRVSRAGAMTLSWTMDKIGPITRSAEDCALVFNAIYGPDGVDQTVQQAPFNYKPRNDLKGVRIGWLENDRESYQQTLAELKELGAELIKVQLPEDGVGNLGFLLSVEAAAAFDELTRSGRDEMMVRQTRDAWPNIFREARLVPAVEYIQANRHRYLLVQKMTEVFEKVDLICAFPYKGRNLLLSNLTGHPCVVLPNAFNEKGLPESVTFIGNLFDEGRLLSVAQAYQEKTGFHKRHPHLTAKLPPE